MKQPSPLVWQSSLHEACTIVPEWKQRGLKGVLCPARNARILYPEDLPALYLPIDDSTDVPGMWYDLAVEFHKNNKPTLVHCMAGQNRSVIFGAALLFADGMDLNEALKSLATVPVCNSILQSLIRWASAKGWRGEVTIARDMSR